MNCGIKSNRKYVKYRYNGGLVNLETILQIWARGNFIHRTRKHSSRMCTAHLWLPLDVSTGGEVGYRSVGMVYLPPGIPTPLVYLTPPLGQKDRCPWKHYLPATTVAGGKNAKKSSPRTTALYSLQRCLCALVLVWKWMPWLLCISRIVHMYVEVNASSPCFSVHSCTEPLRRWDSKSNNGYVSI